MSKKVRIPTPLRSFTAGADEVVLHGATVRDLLESLGRTHEGILERILDNLVVRALVSGQLTALDAVLGELRHAWSRFGQIDELSGYRVRAGVD